MKKIVSTFLITPWIYLFSFGVLLMRFYLKYNASPKEKPIDPKRIDMPINIVVIDVLLLLTFISIPFIFYYIYYSIKNKDTKYKLFSFAGLVGLIVIFYLFKYTNIMEWYFD